MVSWLVRGRVGSVRRCVRRSGGVSVVGVWVWLSRWRVSGVVAGGSGRVASGVGGSGWVVSGPGSVALRAGRGRAAPEPPAGRNGPECAAALLDHTTTLDDTTTPAALLLAQPLFATLQATHARKSVARRHHQPQRRALATSTPACDSTHPRTVPATRRALATSTPTCDSTRPGPGPATRRALATSTPACDSTRTGQVVGRARRVRARDLPSIPIPDNGVPLVLVAVGWGRPPSIMRVLCFRGSHAH